ncbi:MAG: hypothetical protein H6936_09815 [Burkholderiales bacterium]|nr:hypothetical protein [Burkholderiales bacterium]
MQSHPDNVFWAGALNGIVVLILFIAFLGGYFFDTAINSYLMGAAFALASFLLFIFFRFLFTGLQLGLNKIPVSLFAILLAAFASLYLIRLGGFFFPEGGFFFPESVYYSVISLGVIAQVFIFGSLNYFINNKPLKKPFRLVWPYVMLFTVGLGIDIYGIHWMTSKGDNQSGTAFQQINVSQLTDIENPSLTGYFSVRHFTYGSGTDKQRLEFRNHAQYRTEPVDASSILYAWVGSKAKWREKFWGFGLDEFPINGRVWMPEGEGPFPLILIVHGNSSMEKFSDQGYAYLGELLASRGFIAVSVDQNFVNATWSGDFRGQEMPVRGWLLLKHLEQWRTWNQDKLHDLFGKIKIDEIILIGHSRGGEAVAIAASFNALSFFPDNANLEFDFNFNIMGIVEIAPTDERYFRRMTLENINYLSLHGSYDSDQASFFGLRQYQRIEFTDNNYWFNAGLYIHRANHSQFNTVWGEKDLKLPFSWLLDVNSVIAAEEQRQVAKVYISAFAETVLNLRKEYLPIFKNASIIRDWMPSTIYLNNFKDSNKLVIADFEEDIDLTTAKLGSIEALNLKIWREEPLQFRDMNTQENNALILGWDSRADAERHNKSYEIILDNPIDLQKIESLLLSMAAGNPGELGVNNKGNYTGENDLNDDGKAELNFTIQLTDAQNNRLSISSDAIKKIAPRLKINFMKLKSLNKYWGDSWEPSLESFEYPLTDFDGDMEKFGKLHSIKFIFNKTDHGVLIMDNLGFSLTQS